MNVDSPECPLPIPDQTKPIADRVERTSSQVGWMSDRVERISNQVG
jgi:hypothetical protein